mmetsp:Transcript_64802/g.193107  ORF Transcript_64802/g.193107 Transcript_64802/m.193107 type:complete len:241 (+) Transcript_64802:216-938(+)
MSAVSTRPPPSAKAMCGTRSTLNCCAHQPATGSQGKPLSGGRKETSTVTKSTLSPYVLCRSLIFEASDRHSPHQVAEKSTTTGRPDPSEDASGGEAATISRSTEAGEPGSSWVLFALRLGLAEARRGPQSARPSEAAAAASRLLPLKAWPRPRAGAFRNPRSDGTGRSWQPSRCNVAVPVSRAASARRRPRGRVCGSSLPQPVDCPHKLAAVLIRALRNRSRRAGQQRRACKLSIPHNSL